MKLVQVSVFSSFCLALCLSAGCMSSSEEPRADDELGQVAQEVGGQCSANYHCPLGELCNFGIPHSSGGWTCTPYFVIGPTVRPCVDTPQCQVQYNPNSYCSIPPGSSYGECTLF